MTENRGFLIQEGRYFTSRRGFYRTLVRKIRKRREELLNSVNIPSDAKAVARNEILRSLLNVIPNADLLYTNRILNKYSLKK